jgi:hypothetical protein
MLVASQGVCSGERAVRRVAGWGVSRLSVTGAWVDESQRREGGVVVIILTLLAGAIVVVHVGVIVVVIQHLSCSRRGVRGGGGGVDGGERGEGIGERWEGGRGRSSGGWRSSRVTVAGQCD